MPSTVTVSLYSDCICKGLASTECSRQRSIIGTKLPLPRRLVIYMVGLGADHVVGSGKSEIPVAGGGGCNSAVIVTRWTAAASPLRVGGVRGVGQNPCGSVS